EMKIKYSSKRFPDCFPSLSSSVFNLHFGLLLYDIKDFAYTFNYRWVILCNSLNMFGGAQYYCSQNSNTLHNDKRFFPNIYDIFSKCVNYCYLAFTHTDSFASRQ